MLRKRVACMLVCGCIATPLQAAEREDVRKVINLVASVKMPFPENLSRNRAKTDRVSLERVGTTTGCIKLEESQWCFEHIAPEGNRVEMLRIRKESIRGLAIGTTAHYLVDFDLDGLIDVGSTTRIDALERAKRPTPIGTVTQLFHRSTKRGESTLPEYQRMYDEGIQIALRHFGE